jgi:hypothetical protein
MDIEFYSCFDIGVCGGGGITVYSCFENYYTFSKIFTFSNNQTATKPNSQ